MSRLADGSRWRYKRCRVCDKPATPKRHISRRGLCHACAERKMARTIKSLHAKRGPEYRRIAEAQIAGIQRALEESQR